MIDEKEIDALLSYIESVSDTRDDYLQFEFKDKERDMLIDALILYKEMNTH